MIVVCVCSVCLQCVFVVCVCSVCLQCVSAVCVCSVCLQCVSVVHFKFRYNILTSGKIIKEMPSSVASGTPCRFNLCISTDFRYCLLAY